MLPTDGQFYLVDKLLNRAIAGEEMPPATATCPLGLASKCPATAPTLAPSTTDAASL